MLKQLLLAAMLASAVGAAHGDDDRDDRHEVRALVESGHIMPLQTLLQQHEELIEAKILEIELERKHDRYIYEIEILNATGRVDELEVDAASGEILRRQQEN